MYHEWKLVVLGDVLLNFDQYPEDGWLFLPPDSNKWTLQTKGVFSLDSREFEEDSDEYLPPQAKEEGWIESLDTDLISQIMDNFTETHDREPTPEERLAAFKYYYINDAFIEL